MRRIALLFLILFFAGGPASAWHDRGHRAAAQIAWDVMDPAQRTRVISVLRQHPRFAEDFQAHLPADIRAIDDDAVGRWLTGQAATWPDLIQTLEPVVRRTYNRSRWHYINLAVWLTAEDAQALTGALDQNAETVFRQPLRPDMNLVQALKGNLAIWRDPAAAPGDRAIALCWILHLTGDLHQPLHTVALFSAELFPAGDRGGNSIEVEWGDEVRNLHAVWDGLPTDMDDLAPSPMTIRSIESDVVDDDAIDEWLSHHANLARKFVYTEDLRHQVLNGRRDGKPGRVRLSREYLVAARSIARRQLNLTGHRIPELLR